MEKIFNGIQYGKTISGRSFYSGQEKVEKVI
jgi:hypothetical protein